MSDNRKEEEEARRRSEEEEEEEVRRSSENEEEEEESREWKAAYQNVGGGIEATNILLARGRQEKWDLVFVAEAWEGRIGERTTQHKMFGESGSKLILYVREDVTLQDIRIVLRRLAKMYLLPA